MKLSKKNTAIQRAIQKAIASGKALGGLVVGLAATVAGCRENTPADTMGDYPSQQPLQEENCRATAGVPSVPKPAETNTVNEHRNRKANRIMGRTPGLPSKDKSK